jgi:hypothetical protein
VSRLDSFIRRLEAQRACLDFSLQNLVPGAVIELGLGNGRSYDHLRACLAGSRTIYALDRQLAVHPECVPAELVLGEFRDTLPRLASRIGRTVALVHADTGSGDEAASRSQARELAGLLDPLLVDGALIVSDQEMQPRWEPVPLPGGVPSARYFIWRRSANHSSA